MIKVKIKTEYITLGQLIKYLGIVSTGGEIKAFLVENTVFVNGNAENRRGKKLFNGDILNILGKKYIIVTNES